MFFCSIDGFTLHLWRPESRSVCYSCSDKICRWNRIGWQAGNWGNQPWIGMNGIGECQRGDVDDEDDGDVLV